MASVSSVETLADNKVSSSHLILSITIVPFDPRPPQLQFAYTLFYFALMDFAGEGRPTEQDPREQFALLEHNDEIGILDIGP